MTTQYAVLNALSGQTLTAKLFTDADPDTEVAGNTITVTERTNAKGQYRASIVRTPTALPAGNYTVIYFNGSLPAAIGKRTFLGTDGETATETPPTVELDPATRVKLDASQPDYDLPTNTELNAAIAASQLVITTDTADIPRYGDLQRFDQSANNSGNKTADVTITKLS